MLPLANGPLAGGLSPLGTAGVSASSGPNYLTAPDWADGLVVQYSASCNVTTDVLGNVLSWGPKVWRVHAPGWIDYDHCVVCKFAKPESFPIGDDGLEILDCPNCGAPNPWVSWDPDEPAVYLGSFDPI